VTRIVAWLLAAALAASTGALLLDRRNLQQQLTATTVARTASESVRETTERRLAEAALTGKCRPYFDITNGTPARPLEISIYFSLQQDCPSCIEAVIRQWNHAPGFTVKGYTRIDGTYEEKMLAGFEPAFPIVRVERMQETLAAAGLTFTPAVVVSDPATGRILFVHAPLISEKSDTAVTKRLQSLPAPCGAPAG
jgi:hypothetical protein